MAVTEFFSEFDIPIYQTYGMSETSGVSCFNCEGIFASLLLQCIEDFIFTSHCDMLHIVN